MAGLDDYQFYASLKQRDSPFWQKIDDQLRDAVDKGHPKDLRLPLPNTSPRKDNDSGSEDAAAQKYGEVAIVFINLCAENLLSHPFIVLRRQCQVNVTSHRYHLLPFHLLPAMIHLQSQQGVSAFWKGMGSVLTLKGVTLALEDCISKFTPWPKEISPHSSLKSIGEHLLLKCTALAVITPFYSASLVETVQSEITSERPGVLDVFKEGLMRLLSFTQPQSGRMLPVWLLIIPTVSYGVLHYITGNILSTLTSQILRNLHKKSLRRQGATEKKPDAFSDASVRLQSAFVGHLAADVILYPLETVLHRLHLQGTRTIIDSLDVGYEVKPILTRYEGFFDCFAVTVKEEGTLGLFKGFGALCLQYALYGAVLKFAHVLIQEVTNVLLPTRPKPKSQQMDENYLPCEAKPEAETKDHVTPLAPGAPYPPLMETLHPRLQNPVYRTPYPQHSSFDSEDTSSTGSLQASKKPL